MARRLTCPECAQDFDSRGLALHRRIIHGHSDPSSAASLSTKRRPPEESGRGPLPASDATPDAGGLPPQPFVRSKPKAETLDDWFA